MCSLQYKYNHCNIAIGIQLTENHNGNVGKGVTWYICNMGACGLPDICTLGPRGVHIRQTTRAHVTNTKCNTFAPKIKGILNVTLSHLRSKESRGLHI